MFEKLNKIISKLKNKLKNKLKIMEPKEPEVEMVTTIQGEVVPKEEATYYGHLGGWLTDEQRDELDGDTIVYCNHYEDYIWERHARYGYIDEDGNTGYFHSDCDYYSVNDRSENYVISYDVGCDMGLHYHDGEFYDEDPNDDDDSYTFDYHSSNRHFGSEAQSAEWRIAYEVEKEDFSAKSSESAYDCFHRTKWAKERDGSLDDYSGFEFISPVFDMFKVNKDTFANVEKYINASYSKSCGGHINISHISMTARELYGSIKSYMPMLYALYQGRARNTYCPAISKHSNASDKYGAVYIKDSRLEFRIFGAVKDVPNLLWRTELIKYMVSNLNVSEAQVLKNMLDGRGKLYALLRKVYSVDQIIKKAELFYQFCRDYSFEVTETRNYLVKKRIMKAPKKPKSIKSIEGTVWDNPIIFLNWEDLTPEQQDDFMNNTNSPMTTLPIETN